MHVVWFGGGGGGRSQQTIVRWKIQHFSSKYRLINRASLLTRLFQRTIAEYSDLHREFQLPPEHLLPTLPVCYTRKTGITFPNSDSEGRGRRHIPGSVSEGAAGVYSRLCERRGRWTLREWKTAAISPTLAKAKNIVYISGLCQCPLEDSWLFPDSLIVTWTWFI